MFPTVPEATALARLHEQAKCEALRLRREAIDDFWRGADVVWQRGLAGSQTLARRSADRLASRFSRRVPFSPPNTTTKA